MLIFPGREAAGYIGCGGDPVRKAANKFFKLNECSSGGGREDSSKVKARLIKASKCGMEWMHSILSTSKVALAPLRCLLQTVSLRLRQLWVQRTDFSFSDTTEMCHHFHEIGI